MFWLDYCVRSFPNGDFTVEGDWPGEVMGYQRDGTPKDHWLFKPGDVFVVDNDGILRKQEALTTLIYNYTNKKVDL